jgi:hypothetical protein
MHDAKTAVTPRPPTGKTGTSNRARRDPTTHKLGQNAYVTAWRPVARAASGIRRAPQRRASAANARRADLTHAPPRFNAPDAARADRPRAADTPALSLRRGRPPPPPPRAGPSHTKISFARAGRRCRQTAPRRRPPCAGRVDRPASTTLRALGRPPRPPTRPFSQRRPSLRAATALRLLRADAHPGPAARTAGRRPFPGVARARASTFDVAARRRARPTRAGAPHTPARRRGPRARRRRAPRRTGRDAPGGPVPGGGSASGLQSGRRRVCARGRDSGRGRGRFSGAKNLKSEIPTQSPP